MAMIISPRDTPTATATPPAYDAAVDASTTKVAVVFVTFVPCRNTTDKMFLIPKLGPNLQRILRLIVS